MILCLSLFPFPLSRKLVTKHERHKNINPLISSESVSVRTPYIKAIVSSDSRHALARLQSLRQLDTRYASTTTFSIVTVSLKQAQRHSPPFQRWRCPWNKRSGTWHFFNDDGVPEPSVAALDFFKDDGVLETSDAALGNFSTVTVSLKQV